MQLDGGDADALRAISQTGTERVGTPREAPELV